MKTLDMLKDQIIKRSTSTNYALEKSQLKSEFSIMCNRYLKSPKEVLVFTPSTPRDLNTFLDIFEDEDLTVQFQITQEDKNTFRVQLKDLDLV